MSKRLELYVNQEDGGSHTLVVVEGHARNPAPFTHTGVEEMMREALRLIKSDTDFESGLRIFDPSRRVVRSFDMSLDLKTLEVFVQGAVEPAAA